MTITPEKIAELRALLEKCPTEWEVYSLLPNTHELCLKGNYATGGIATSHRRTHLELAARLRNAAPDLLDEIERLRENEGACDEVYARLQWTKETNKQLIAERDRYRDVAVRLAITLRQICIGDDCDEWLAIQAGREELLKPDIAALLEEAENG